MAGRENREELYAETAIALTLDIQAECQRIAEDSDDPKVLKRVRRIFERACRMQDFYIEYRPRLVELRQSNVELTQTNRDLRREKRMARNGNKP